MTNDEILEGNKLIAEFFNNEYVDENRWISNNQLGLIRVYNFKELNLFNQDERNLKFHLFWDWLMPVVNKIELLDYLNLNVYSAVKFRRFNHVDTFWVIDGISDCGDNKVKISNFISNHGKNEIDTLYATITEFIKWHNKINK